MRRLLGTLVLVAMAVARPAPAHACSTVTRPHVLVPAMQATDSTPPVLPQVLGVQITRGRGPQGDGCGGDTSSSCDDIGSIAIAAQATDDMTRADRIGYRFTVIAGAPPEGFTAPADALEPAPDGTVSMYWDDGAFDDQDPIDMTLQVVAIDLAGNQSAPQNVRVQQSFGGNGCRLGGSPPERRHSLSAIFALWAVLSLRLRRRDVRHG